MPTLDWIGKKAVINHDKQVPFHLLNEVPELSYGDKDSGNMLIQGDNLIALKSLLPYYAGKVKCIYIDPPYNTGNEGWIYNDNVNSPEIKEWLGNVVGKEAEDLSRHDKWLCMMYPRLKLLREFLREDGVIFISIDENEHRFLELLMDEIFGAQNRLSTLVWQNNYGGGAKSKHVVNLHEYIVMFAKNITAVSPIELPPDEKILKYYKYRDEKFEKRGPYRLQPLATTSMDDRPNLRYPIIHNGIEIWPEKQWYWEKTRTEKAQEQNILVFSNRNGKWTVNYKQYLKDENGVERKSKPYSIITEIFTQAGTKEIKDLFGDGKAFDFPKPSELVKLLISMITNHGDYVLDSFAGSGTTAHAVCRLNEEDHKDRRFILVEMGDYANTITAERIRRVIKSNELSTGFRYYRLGSPLFDEFGNVFSEIKFADLAKHVFFSETGMPLPDSNDLTTPFIGEYNERGIFLLYNGILKDKNPKNGNVLTREVLAMLPKFDGEKVIYGTGCRLSDARLKAERITFKQIPYDLRG